MLETTRLASDLPTGSWVRASFLGRFRELLPVWMDSLELWLEQGDRMPEGQLRELAGLRDLLCRLPEGREFVRAYQDYLAKLCEYTRERDPARSEILEDLLALSLKAGPM
jgi:hypothetical protein